MSEQIGASAVIDPAPLPTDPGEAQAMRERLMADAEYAKAAASGDKDKYTTLGYLRWVAAGNPAELWGAPPASPVDVRAQMSDRDLALDDRRLNNYARDMRLNDQAQLENRRGLATQEQHDEALRELDRMKADGSWARMSNGDKFTKEKWMRFNRIASMVVAPPDYDWQQSTEERK